MRHTLGTAFISHRTWQRRAVLLLTLLISLLGTLGVYALSTAPILIEEEAGPLSEIELQRLQRIAHLSLDHTFFLRFPEFFTPTAETTWWHLQHQVYDAVQEREAVEVEWTGQNGIVKRERVQVGRVSFFDAVQRTWLIYLVVVLYLVSAFSVFQRHRGPPGVVLTFFFVACALYFTSAAPLVTRPLTLQPLAFQVLVYSLYTAAGGLISLAHFALLFPEPKPILQRHPWLPLLLYGFFVLASVLYLSGLTAFGTTFPFFCLWVLVIAGAFLHSLWQARDLFLKKQIWLSLLAPVLACLFFVLFLLPGVLGWPQVSFSSFALFSLILPFALPFAMDNLALYQQRLAAERQAQHEKERLREDLHDLHRGLWWLLIHHV